MWLWEGGIFLAFEGLFREKRKFFCGSILLDLFLGPV